MMVRRPFMSSLGLTYQEIMSLPIARKRFLLERLRKDWETETRAAKK